MKTTADKTTTASAPETRTFTHVNTGKPAGIRETQNEEDNREARTIPAEKPTAIHTEDVLDDGPDGFEREDGSETQHGSVESERDSYKSHADKLAEALRDCLDVMERVHGLTLPVHLGAFCEEQDWSTAVLNARKALPAYEESR